MAQNRRSIQTKETILETATHLFYEKGYTATTIREICSQSGISVSRVNYHFSSKAELAGVVCSQFVHNFIQELRNLIGNFSGYSIVVESIALRFLVDLLLSDPEAVPASRFYREITREGILSEAFSPGDKNFFSRTMALSQLRESQFQPGYTDIYARILSAALAPLIDSWDQVLELCDADREKANWRLQDIFVALFMQLLDFRHDVQQDIVDLSRNYYRMMDIELQNLTQIHITISQPLHRNGAE
jgi:AcrR family transcriptional regulator